MGVISGERNTGTATLLYVRPISFKAYFLSKWLTVNAIVLGSVWLGFFSAWYYISILFNRVDLGQVFGFIAIYSVWIIFVVTVVLALSATFSTGITATLALVVTFVFQIVDALIGKYWTVSPWKLSAYASSVFEENAKSANMWWSVGVTIVLIVALILLGIAMSKRNSAKTTV